MFHTSWLKLNSFFILIILHFIVHTNSTVGQDTFFHWLKLNLLCSLFFLEPSLSGPLSAVCRTEKYLCESKFYTETLSSIPISIILVFCFVFRCSLASEPYFLTCIMYKTVDCIKAPMLKELRISPTFIVTNTS